MMQRILCGKSIPAIGLGCMGMSEFYGITDDNESMLTLHQAVEIGYRHFDTADMYGAGHNEALLARFLGELGAGGRDRIVLATKGGITRSQDEKFRIGANGRKSYLREACHASLRRLGVDYIDLYYYHRLDAATPIEESIETLNELRLEGKIGGIGLCEVSADVIDAALQVAPIAALQSEYSLWSRDLETDILSLCAREGIAVVAFSPLGRGFLSAKIDQESIRGMNAELDLRTRLPRFDSENLPKNLVLVKQLESHASKLGMTSAQLALSWLLSKNPTALAIPGSKSPRYLKENFEALRHPIGPDPIEELDRIFDPRAIHGGRYPANVMKQSS